MAGEDFNLRVHLYGTQGSGSSFPSRAERLAFQRRSEIDLLALVLRDLQRHADATGRIACTVEELVGGPPAQEAIAAYLQRFMVPEPRVYGGWTTCVRIETGDGYDLVLDCGSGFRNCAHDLQEKWGAREERHLHVFGSHSHLDHTEGFDQAAVCFDARNHLHVYGNHQFLRALDFNLGIFSRQVDSSVQGVQTPIFFGVMPARFHACAIGGVPDPVEDGRRSLCAATHPVEMPIHLGETAVTPFEVFHPAPCLAYRIERRGRTLVFCTDHELRHGDPSHPDQHRSEEAEARLIRYSQGIDLLYRDGQYLRAEYDGRVGIGGSSAATPRIGWGHSSVEDVIDMAAACDVRHTLIGHHDPNRGWAERNAIDESLAQLRERAPHRIELACAETMFQL